MQGLPVLRGFEGQQVLREKGVILVQQEKEVILVLWATLVLLEKKVIQGLLEKRVTLVSQVSQEKKGILELQVRWVLQVIVDGLVPLDNQVIREQRV
jgi:hypothetical protein